MPKANLILAALAVVTVTVVGCNHNVSTPGEPIAVAPMTQEQVQSMEKNPHVSPQMKAAILAQQNKATGN